VEQSVKILIVSISIDFPLANYCLAAQILASPALRGCKVELLDLDWRQMSSYERKTAETWRYLSKIDGLKPDAIGFSVYLWNNLAIRELVAITNLLFPSVRIVIGGPEVATTDAAEDWLQTRAVSVVVRGEGERTFEEVLQRFAQRDDCRRVAGTSSCTSEGFVHEVARQPSKTLDEFASPFLGGLVAPDLFARNTVPLQPARYSRALMETYRGCYMQCSYCQWGNGSKSRYEFPEDRVQEEIACLLSFDVRGIFIVDAMFGFKKSRAISILEFIVQEKRRLGSKTTFNLYHNQDFFDDDLFDLYREAEASIEIDMQSTNREVLDRLGRGRWYKETFDRHLTAIREKRVPTTGAADLIIGIPGDNLESFEDSVDFLLRRRMRVNLYQASILPDTGWSRSIKQDKIVFSPVPPRSILKNDTFPLSDMINARLIGHGTDLFNSFPRTAEILWRRWYERPVDLCRSVGDLVFRRHGLVYSDCQQVLSESVVREIRDDWVSGFLDSLGELIRSLCPDRRQADILLELLQFEGALSAVKWAPNTDRMTPAENWRVDGDQWLAQRPKFRREKTHRIAFRYLINELVLAWDRSPDPDLLDVVSERNNAVIFFNDGKPQYFVVDVGVTDQLLQRFNGYFSVQEAIENLGLRLNDMSPVWSMLSLLAESALIVPGYEAPHTALPPKTKVPAPTYAS
jgi:hypothetical protein